MPLDGPPASASSIAWDVDDYARNSRMQEEYARKHLSQLELGGGEAVLEVGCGDGRLTAEIAQRVPRGRVIGIDSSQDMIAAARCTQQPHHNNLTFEAMDAAALSFAAQFDLVFSTSALHWVKDHFEVLEGIKRALKPGGKMYLTFGAKGTLSGLAPVMAALMENPRWKARFGNFEVPFGFYGPKDYLPWLDRVGFTVDRLELIERDATHQGREVFEGWLRTTAMPYTHRVEPDRRQEFLRHIVDDYIARNPIDAQGWVHVRMANLLVKATKTRG